MAFPSWILSVVLSIILHRYNSIHMKALSFYQPNKALLKAIAKEFKALRLAKNLTFEELSELCGLHEKYLQTISRNRHGTELKKIMMNNYRNV